MHPALDVARLITKRDAYLTARTRLWSLPGEPLIGIVSASDAEHWHALGRQAQFLDERIEQVRQVVGA
jgi:hypothetical protein